ncbi:hypothetical protein [Wenjunlia tyrosinilytica]|uniref:Uncharacterized protein n=1 Tax=Wenjunlia tyrosinilytica TaxID=1544741 RepID=A0A917ZKR5_9ACTN|nr:hypothetical protein [Wenjunlia tyrosinilytica]GGO85219.1 hypothetical protein GCM10012280_18500 [Wenjunlia tyrosinilytica]
MNKISAALTTAVLAAGLTVAAAPLSSAATAAPAPKFLTASELPHASTPWHADKVKKGLPGSQSFCTRGVIPAAKTSYRDFRTELDTGARQITHTAATTAKAKKLVTDLRKAFASCADRLEHKYPSVEAKGKYHGRIDVEEGAYVYSLDTKDTEVGSTDINLSSVGRDGRTVTYVDWGQMGDLKDAPLKGFKKTTRTAVAKLY